MITAYQPTSFQNDAFQIDTAIRIPSYQWVVKVAAGRRREVVVDGAKRAISVQSASRTTAVPQENRRVVQTSKTRRGFQ